MIETDFHCSRCGACPGEGCTMQDGRSTRPHPEREAALLAWWNETSDSAAS